jgi:hypothetical protein
MTKVDYALTRRRLLGDLKDFPDCPAILRVCHQIYQEAA